MPGTPPVRHIEAYLSLCCAVCFSLWIVSIDCYKLLGRTKVERVTTFILFSLTAEEGQDYQWTALALWQLTPFNFKIEMKTEREKCCHLRCTGNG